MSIAKQPTMILSPSGTPGDGRYVVPTLPKRGPFHASGVVTTYDHVLVLNIRDPQDGIPVATLLPTIAPSTPFRQ